MNTYRALCTELLQPLAEYDSANPYHEHRDLITRASAELAQPEAVGPTRDELRTMAAEFAARTPEEFALAVLARWGRPALTPTPVSERLPSLNKGSILLDTGSESTLSEFSQGEMPLG